MTKLRYLSLGEHAIIGDIIADSFADDPVALWVFGGQSGIQHYITKIAQKHYLQKGYGYVMDDQSGGSLWLPPGIKKQLPLIKSIDIAVPMIKNGDLKPITRGSLSIMHYVRLNQKHRTTIFLPSVLDPLSKEKVLEEN